MGCFRLFSDLRVSQRPRLFPGPCQPRGSSHSSLCRPFVDRFRRGRPDRCPSFSPVGLWGGLLSPPPSSVLFRGPFSVVFSPGVAREPVVSCRFHEGVSLLPAAGPLVPVAGSRSGVSAVSLRPWVGRGPLPPFSPGPRRGPSSVFSPLGGGARARFSSRTPGGRATGRACVFSGRCVAGFCGSPTGGFGLPPPGGLVRRFTVGGVPPCPFLGTVYRPLRALGVITGCASPYDVSPALRLALRSCFVAGSGRAVFLSHLSR